MANKVIKILLIGLIVLLIAFLGFKYSWRLFDDKDELITFSLRVENTKNIPDSLMDIYTTVYPHHINKSTIQEIVIGYGSNILAGVVKDYDNCFCDEIIRDELFGYKKYPKALIRRFQSLRLSFGLESLVEENKCLNYYLIKEYEEVNRNNSSYAYTWANKTIFELTKLEFIEFLAIRNAPRYYNKFLNKDNYNRSMNFIENKIKNASL
ncbi:hypothetical protein V6R21_11535 [Limibacter armeniacum]|uniref:hypothetical protein n=1 Tax=Limibacter armeniacum TaxID=466084 RepID=UPI002FE63BA2